MSYAYWDSSFLVLMTKRKFRGEKAGEGRITDVRRQKMFMKNKSPISSSRFPSTSPCLCKIVCSQGSLMLMFTCVTEHMTNTQLEAINSTSPHSPYIAGPSPPVSGCQVSWKDSCLWESCTNLAKSTAKWSSPFPTHMPDGGIHLLPTEGPCQWTRLLYHQLQ